MKNLLFIVVFSLLLSSCNLSRTNFAMTSIAMLPTLNTGDHVKITKRFDTLDYGDIVVFKFDGTVDEGEEMRSIRRKLNVDEDYRIQGYFIFRIAGLPGDSIAIENDICIINGTRNESKLIRKRASNKNVDKMLRRYVEEYREKLPNGINICLYKYSYRIKSAKNMETIKIPENHYFLMGDFRSEALDSRYIGTIPKDQIIGKVINIKQNK